MWWLVDDCLLFFHSVSPRSIIQRAENNEKPNNNYREYTQRNSALTFASHRGLKFGVLFLMRSNPQRIATFNDAKGRRQRKTKY
jgi:hypothetical protein